MNSKEIREFILDTLFPIRCISCKKEGAWLCEGCFGKIRIKDDHVCGVCEKIITPDGRTCLACKKLPHRQTGRQSGKNSIDGLIVATSYLDLSVSRAVHLYKYNFVSDLHQPLGDLLVSALRKTDIPLPEIILPVPLHPRRLRWRGFNQSALLANCIASKLLPGTNLVVDETLLLRTRYTTPQMGIKDYKNRSQNIAGAFSVSDSEKVKGKTFLLVDDIATTGSTIFQCAKALKDAGASEVFAIVIARQETKSKTN
jgi:ComF family protein